MDLEWLGDSSRVRSASRSREGQLQEAGVASCGMAKTCFHNTLADLGYGIFRDEVEALVVERLEERIPNQYSNPREPREPLEPHGASWYT